VTFGSQCQREVCEVSGNKTKLRPKKTEMEPLLNNLRATVYIIHGSLFMHEIFELLYEISLGRIFSYNNTMSLLLDTSNKLNLLPFSVIVGRSS
jgi:hypothetical protein